MSSSVIEISDLVGLTSAKRIVEAVRDRESGVHAILFYGQRGSGKTTLARSLAASWLCKESDGGVACGSCGVCTSFANDRSVDFLTIKPTGASAIIVRGAFVQDKNKPDHSVIPLTEYFRSRPLMAATKVAHIRDAHRLNQDATNAFLQTLEEPPDHARMILTTHEFSRVPATIRSRCLCVACELPTDDRITSAIGELSSVESVFGATPGGVMLLRKTPEPYQKLFNLLESLAERPKGAALLVGEELRSISSELADQTDLNLSLIHI